MWRDDTNTEERMGVCSCGERRSFLQMRIVVTMKKQYLIPSLLDTQVRDNLVTFPVRVVGKWAMRNADRGRGFLNAGCAATIWICAPVEACVFKSGDSQQEYKERNCRPWYSGQS